MTSCDALEADESGLDDEPEVAFAHLGGSVLTSCQESE